MNFFYKISFQDFCGISKNGHFGNVNKNVNMINILENVHIPQNME
jgi:hypothetical protein